MMGMQHAWERWEIGTHFFVREAEWKILVVGLRRRLEDNVRLSWA
jgi:hypothetical protein